MAEHEHMPNRYVDVQDGRKAVRMEVNVWQENDGDRIHVTCDGDRSFHGYLRPDENLHGHFQRVLRRADRWTADDG